MSVYTTVFSASMPIGGLAMGAVASGFGASIAIGVGGVLTVALGLGALAWGRRGALTIPTTALASNESSAMLPGAARPR
jgi:hypothetical protein